MERIWLVEIKMNLFKKIVAVAVCIHSTHSIIMFVYFENLKSNIISLKDISPSSALRRLLFIKYDLKEQLIEYMTIICVRFGDGCSAGWMDGWLAGWDDDDDDEQSKWSSLNVEHSSVNDYFMSRNGQNVSLFTPAISCAYHYTL